jgi:hypothetical protein
MANLIPLPNVRRIARDLQRVVTHVVQCSGVPSRDSGQIKLEACAIAELAARLLDECDRTEGLSRRQSMVRKVRKALGDTYP